MPLSPVLCLSTVSPFPASQVAANCLLNQGLGQSQTMLLPLSGAHLVLPAANWPGMLLWFQLLLLLLLLFCCDIKQFYAQIETDNCRRGLIYGLK